ncbi:hypothetical protein Tco_0153259 [Tanacetum coccineum]
MSIRRIKDIVCEYSGRYQTWSLLQETPICCIQYLGYADEVPPKSKNDMPLRDNTKPTDTFYNSLNTNDQDALDSAAGGNFLDKMPRDGLAIIESKSKVRYSRSRAIEQRASTNAPSPTSSPSNNSFEIQQMAVLLEDKMNIRMSRLEKAISEKKANDSLLTDQSIEKLMCTCGSRP